MGRLDELYKLLTAKEKTYVYAGDVTKSCYPKRMFLVSDVKIVPGNWNEDLIARAFGYPEGTPAFVSFKLQRYADGKLIEFHRGVESYNEDPESSLRYAGITFPSKEELDEMNFVDGIPYTEEDEQELKDFENRTVVRQMMIFAIRRYFRLAKPDYSEDDLDKVLKLIDSMSMTPGDVLASKRVPRSRRLFTFLKK